MKTAQPAIWQNIRRASTESINRDDSGRREDIFVTAGSVHDPDIVAGLEIERRRDDNARSSAALRNIVPIVSQAERGCKRCSGCGQRVGNARNDARTRSGALIKRVDESDAITRCRYAVLIDKLSARLE